MSEKLKLNKEGNITPKETQQKVYAFLTSKGWIRERDGYWIHKDSLNLTKLTTLEVYGKYV